MTDKDALLFGQDVLPKAPAAKKRKPVAIETPVWTDLKARLIQRYCRYFEFVTHHGTYIDGFAGPQYRDHPDAWAARLVLEETKWFRTYFLSELSPPSVALLQELKARIQKQIEDSPPPRLRKHIEVFAGDFNTTIDAILASPKITEKVATFCLLDMRMFECDWATVVKIARHKKERKIELFYFFGAGWADRSISNADPAKVTRWWGNESWRSLLGIGSYAQQEVICGRMRDELGYKHVSAYAIYNKAPGSAGQRRLQYYMIHASDHDDAPTLMNRAYRKVTEPPETDEALLFDLEPLKKASRRAKRAAGSKAAKPA